MSEEFYLLKTPEAEPEGPFLADDLMSMVGHEEVPDGAFVARKGDPEWKPIAEWIARQEEEANWIEANHPPSKEERARIARMLNTGCRIKVLGGGQTICPAAAKLAAGGPMERQSADEVELFPLKACDRAKYCECLYVAAP